METTEGGTTLAKRFDLESYEIDETLDVDYFRHVGITKEKKTGRYVDVKILKKAEIININQKSLGVLEQYKTIFVFMKQIIEFEYK